MNKTGRYLLLLFFTHFFGFNGFSFTKMAVKGKVNLHDWNPEKVQDVSLEGNWSFFWKKLLDPKDIQKGEIPQAEWRPSHGVWKGKRGTTGYGTYLLKVEGLRPGNYVLGKTYIYNSFNIFVVSSQKIQKVLQFGNVSKKVKEDVPYMGYLSGSFSVGAEPFYIVVQISNYSFRNGGILGHFTLTSKDVFDKNHLLSIIMDTFIIGCLIIAGIYHLFIFFLRRKDKLSLWFALSVFLLALRAYFGPGYIYWAYPDTSFIGLSIKSRLYYLTFYPLPFFLAYFLFYLLEEVLNKKILAAFTAHSFILVCLSLFFGVEYYAHSIVLYSFYAVFLVGMVHLIYIFGVLFYQKKYHHILNFIPTAIFCAGSIHDILINFVAENPVYILPYTIILFVILQSYNIAKKNSIAHNTAEKLSEDLEKEVKIQTREAVDAKEKAETSEQKVAELINNMRQAVFITNEKSVVIDPVSTFSAEIFDENIEGQTVYETLFRNLDRKSEEYAKIMTCTGVIFGADDLQWLMMYELLPPRIIYKKSDKDLEKILKVIYTPLYNRDGILERLMYVIEDVTEVEKLEKQMVIEREEGSKKSHIIQELVSNKKEDLTQFFHDTIKIFKNTMTVWKNLRVLISEKKEPKGLEGFLRNLHTIKGNSRIYGFSHISKITHKVESTFSILSKNPFNEWSSDDLSQFTQELYGLQGQINEYLWLAEEILGVETEEEMKLKEEFHTGLKELEYWLGHFHHYSLDSSSDQDVSDFGIFEKIHSLDEDYREQIFVSLKRSFHGIKGLARSIGNKDLSSLIHRGESIIFKLEEGSSSPEEIKNDLFPSLIKIRKESSIIFFNSSQFKSLDLNYDLWTEIFYEYFNVVVYWKDQENLKFNELTRRVYLLYAKSTGGQFLYIPIIIRTLYDYMELGWEEQKDEIHFCLKMIWKFIVLIFKLDLNKKVNVSSRRIMLEKLIQGKNEKNSEGFVNEINKMCEIKESPLFLNSLTRVLKEGYSPQDFYSVVSYFNFGDDNNFYHLISEQDIFFKFNDIYLILKESFKEGRDHLHLEELNIKTEEGEEENDEMAGFLNELLDHHNPTWFQYLLKIELLRVLKNYVSVEDDREQEIRPDSLDILSQNYFKAKDAIENLMETEQLKEKVNDYFNFLLEVPVKYSFRNLKTMVNEVGKSLGKKITLKMDGDQGSLHKDSLTLLKDAIIHIVRNSIDHGIESPEERKQLGKPEIGEINIQCQERDQGQLFIQIKDDGRGIDEEKICLKALEKGILTEKEINVMSSEEKTKIIFIPGFSTKEEVTEISGRGIGMDVVKMNLHRIGGNIEIQNTKGKGTQFDIYLKKI